MTIKLSLMLFVLAFALPAQADIYKWTDAEGKAHFSSSRPANPASIENRNDLEVKSPQPAPAIDKPAAKTAATPKVDLYITKWCPYCKKALAFLRENDIAFTAFDIEQDLVAAARKKAIDPGYSGIPLAVINGAVIRGFDEDTYQQALANR